MVWDCPVCGIRRDPLGGEYGEVNLCSRGQRHWDWDIQLWKRTAKDREYATYLRCCFCENATEKCRSCNRRKSALLASLQATVEAAVDVDDFPTALQAWEDSGRDMKSRADRNRMLLQLAKVAVACSSGVAWLEANSDKLSLVMRESTLDASKPWLRCLRQVSDSIGNLTGLVVTLNLSGNQDLERLPIRALCHLRSLKGLDVRSCPKLLSPPPQICALPPDQTLKFLRDAMSGGRLHDSCVLFVVGASSSGKTSLISAITRRSQHEKFQAVFSTNDRFGVPSLDMAGVQPKPRKSEATHGAVATKWQTEGEKGTTLLFVELGGHDGYMDAYRSFLSRRALYLLCWDAHAESTSPHSTQLATVKQWLAILQNRAPGVPILLVATHSAKLSASALEAQTQRAREAASQTMAELVLPESPRTVEILDGGRSAAVDSVEDVGVDQLRMRVLSQVRKTRWFEEAVPREFVKLEWSIRLKAQTTPCIPRQEFHELCTSAGVASNLIDWVTRWLHDALEIRDLGTSMIWVSVPWVATVVNGALEPQRDRLKAYIRDATAQGRPWAEKMDGQLRRLQVMGRLNRALMPFIWDVRPQSSATAERTPSTLPSPDDFWEEKSHQPDAKPSGGSLFSISQFASSSTYANATATATAGRRGSKGMRGDASRGTDAWKAGAELLRLNRQSLDHAELLLKHLDLVSDSGPELAGPMLGGHYRKLVIEAGALSHKDCLLWATYRFLSLPPGMLRAVIVRLQAKTLHCEANLMGAALYTDGRMMQIFESTVRKSITVRAATDVGLEIATKEVEQALDLFPGAVLLKKEAGPRDVVLPVQMLIITTAAVGWKQFREEVARPRLRDDIMGDFWDSTAGTGGTGVRNTLCKMIMEASGGGPNRLPLDVELFGRFVQFTGPARVAVLLLSGDAGARFEEDEGLRERLRAVTASGGWIIALWMPDCQVDDHKEWWPAAMADVLDWNTPYVDLRNKNVWQEKVSDELIPMVQKLLKLWRGSPGLHGRMVKCPTCRPLGLVTGQFSAEALEDRYREWRVRTSQGGVRTAPTETCARGHTHATLEILQGEGGSASLRCDAVPCPRCVAEGTEPPGCFDVWQRLAPYYRGELPDGHGAARCQLCTMRTRVLDIVPPHVFIAFAPGSRSLQMDGLARTLLSILEEEAGTVNCLGGGLELAGCKGSEVVRRASVVLLLLTDDFVFSPECSVQLADALGHSKPVVPVLLRPAGHTLPRQDSNMTTDQRAPVWTGWSGVSTAGKDWCRHAETLTGSRSPKHEGGDGLTFRSLQSSQSSRGAATLNSRRNSRHSDSTSLLRPWKALAELEVEPVVMRVTVDPAGNDVTVHEGDCHDVVARVVDTLLAAPWPEVPTTFSQVTQDAGASLHGSSPISRLGSALTSHSGSGSMLNVTSPMDSPARGRRKLSETHHKSLVHTKEVASGTKTTHDHRARRPSLEPGHAGAGKVALSSPIYQLPSRMAPKHDDGHLRNTSTNRPT